MNAVFAWWRLSDVNRAGTVDGQFKRLQVFTSDLQKAYGDTYGAQVSALLGANERIGRSLLEFVQCRQPQDLIAAESNVVAVVLKEASLQTKAWLELSEKIQQCCATMARETAGEIRKHANTGTDVERNVKGS
ncbi:hypothetical protein [Muricoccus roseus]|nr:hypothetical protein [Roseomonas rosea]